MFKYIKSRVRLYLQKKNLKKNNIVFNLNNYNFKLKNVLIIDEIIPEYNKDSGSRRLTEIIKLLLKNNVSVFLVADLKQSKYKSSYIAYFKTLGVNVYEPCIDNKGELVTKEAFIKHISPKMDMAWLHRPTIFNKFHDLIKNENPNIKLIFDMVDFHYIRFMREFELNKNNKVKNEADKFLQIELDNCKKSDVIIAISKTDEILLEQHFKQKDKVVVLSNIHQYILDNSGFKPYDKRQDLLFIGGFKHDPNIDAVKYLYEEIMPIIWKTEPDIKVNIIGSSVTEDIKSYQSSKFNIIGFVDHLDQIINSSKVFIAPLRFGAGIKGKIGQSLEFGLPVITTSVGEEGFEFGKMENIMVANTAQDFADSVITIYNTQAVWEQVSDSCQEILNPFSIQQTEKTLIKIINL